MITPDDASTRVLVAGPHAGRGLVVCADVGSTFTKLAVVDTAGGHLVATATHPTTLRDDVMNGVDAACDALARKMPDADLGRVIACSSAGGGLRLAVVGYEPAVTARAGHQVGLSAGAKVVHVAGGLLEAAGIAALAASAPDLVLLVGGTDGGNSQVLLANAAALAQAGLGVPVVLAGNAAVQEQAAARLTAHDVDVAVADNVLPEIGVVVADPARSAIRAAFLRHVIGGKGLSPSGRLEGIVRAPTPDAVLRGVEVLADLPGLGDVVVVDIGGATTDVYSALAPDTEDAGRRREVAPTPWRSRTVEGDLGMRWGAAGIVEAALAEGLLTPDEDSRLGAAASRRVADPAYVPTSAAERDLDLRLASLAVLVAVRRHARPTDASSSRRGGRDLSRVRLLLGSGGVLRHAGNRATEPLAAARSDFAGGVRVPERATLGVDLHYVLAAAGLLAFDDPERDPDVATGLLASALADVTLHRGVSQATRRTSSEIPAVQP